MLAIFKDGVISGRWRFSQSPTLIRVLAWILAALVVGWVLAGWFWQLASPDATPQFETAPLLDHQAAATAVVSRHLFGRPSSGGDEKGGVSVGVRLNLLGAMTASPEAAGFAILAEEGKPPMAVVEGETFMPGATLLEVLPGRVRLSVGERVETIEMMKSANTAGTAPGDMSATAVGIVPDRRDVPARPKPRPERRLP
jgi:hypothetical protein